MHPAALQAKAIADIFALGKCPESERSGLLGSNQLGNLDCLDLAHPVVEVAGLGLSLREGVFSVGLVSGDLDASLEGWEGSVLVLEPDQLVEKPDFLPAVLDLTEVVVAHPAALKL